jgi:hypothetical protein
MVELEAILKGLGYAATITQWVGVAWAASQGRAVVGNVKKVAEGVLEAPKSYYRVLVFETVGHIVNNRTVIIIAEFLWRLKWVSLGTLGFFLLGKTAIGKSVAGLFTAIINRLSKRVENGEGLPSLLSTTKIQAQNLKNKVEEIRETTPAKSPGRLKLDQELAELKMLVQKLQVRPKTPSPVKIKTPSPVRVKTPSPNVNYIYVGGRKIPLRRRLASPAKAKEGRLRKVIRHVLHGRTEEEKMRKLAKSLRRRALSAAVAAKSRSASAARTRSASAARSRSASKN